MTAHDRREDTVDAMTSGCMQRSHRRTRTPYKDSQLPTYRLFGRFIRDD